MCQLIFTASVCNTYEGSREADVQSGPRGNSKILDSHQHRFNLDISKTDIQVVRHAMRKITIDENLIDIRQTFKQAITQSADTTVLQPFLHAPDGRPRPYRQSGV